MPNDLAYGAVAAPPHHHAAVPVLSIYVFDQGVQHFVLRDWCHNA